MSAAEQAGISQKDGALSQTNEHIRLSPYIRVLACVELFRNISSYLTQVEIDRQLFRKDYRLAWSKQQSAMKEGRAAIAALAAVCKAISPVAISALWERLDSADPVVALCAIFPVTDASSPLPLGFQRYTNEVRSIKMETGFIPEALLADRDTPALPNLQQLHWVATFNAPIQPFVGLIVPTMRDLRVHVTPQPFASKEAENAAMTAALLDALRAAAQRCLSLETLELHWSDGPPLSASAAICEILPLMRSLRSLSVSAQAMAFAPALLVLSQLPFLRILGIKQFGGSQSGLDALQNSLQRVASGFSLLEELRLSGSFSLVHEILQCMPKCAVRRCTVTLAGVASEDKQQAIVESVLLKFGTSIHAFSIKTEVLVFPNNTLITQPAVNPGPPCPVSALSTLRTRNMTELSIGSLDPSHVTDELCRDLALAWPRLRVLHLTPIGEYSYALPALPRATLQGLRYFAEHCPALSSIVIAVDASGEHWAEAAATMPPVQRTNAASLDLTRSPVTSPEAVAAYLKRSFHSFEDVRFSRPRAYIRGGDAERAMSRAWERVCSILLGGDRA
ncbi:hypothetical protein FKP32DRAFT_1649430 [Trametes sanguinea]|nr:hypothetical protein FKP32DRAFT_1649430 [Trametes sanguinea]